MNSWMARDSWRHRVRRLLVCAENGELIGIVSDSDVFGALPRLDSSAAPSFSL
jgi:CBS domain-containing protein